MESNLYNQDGKVIGSVKLPEDVFGAPWNGDLIHQVTVSMQSNKRSETAHAKTRGEVAGGGKKPWRQKGTGRARHGSTRSPIWVGGGVAHGPRNDKDYSRKINKKMKAKALFTLLSKKLKDNEVIFVDKFSLAAPKTSEAKSVLSKFSKGMGIDAFIKKPKNAAILALPKKDQNTELGLRNFANISISDVRSLNPLSVLSAKYVIFSEPEESFSVLKNKVVVNKNK